MPLFVFIAILRPRLVGERCCCPLRLCWWCNPVVESIFAGGQILFRTIPIFAGGPILLPTLPVLLDQSLLSILESAGESILLLSTAVALLLLNQSCCPLQLHCSCCQLFMQLTLPIAQLLTQMMLLLTTLTRLLVEPILLLLLVVSAVCAATVSCFSGLRRYLLVVSAVCAATGCHQPHCWQPDPVPC